MSKEFKVGLVVLLGIVFLFAGYIFFHKISIAGKTYEIKTTFKNLEKLDTGAVVRLSGFKIGNVTEIKLTEQSHVLVKMRIDKNINIPKDSTCVATTGAVIGEMFIKITPGDSKEYLKEGDTIVAVSKANFDDLTKKVNDLLTLTGKAMKSINDILDNKDYIVEIMKNISEASNTANDIAVKIDDLLDRVNVILINVADITDASKDDLIGTTHNIKKMSDNGVEISEDLNNFLKQDAYPQLKTLLESSNLTLKNLNSSIETAKLLLQNMDTQMSGVGDLIKDADAILIKSQSTIDKVDTLLVDLDATCKTTNSVMGKVDNFLADEENMQNIKDTIKNIKETSQEANELLKKINGKVGGKSSEKLIDGKVTSDNMYIGQDKKFRSDFYGDLYFGKNGVRAGINDIGGKNKGIIQYERKLDQNNIAKIGVFNSKVGLGYEYVNKNWALGFDWYNPNRSEIYVRGKYKFSPNWGLFVGVDDIVQNENKKFMVGLSFEK